MVWWFIAVFVVALVAVYSAMPKPQSAKPPGLGDINAPTAEEGREIPVLFGTKDLTGPNVVGYGDLKTKAIRKKAGKSLSFKTKYQTVGHEIYLGIHQILSHGPADRLLRYTVEERVAWSGQSTGGTIDVKAGTLFGKRDAEGGVEGLMDLEMGGPAQVANNYLKTLYGQSEIPAFLGVVGIVQRQMYLGNSAYLRKNAFRLQRIHKKTGSGDLQWYDEKAQVSIGSEEVTPMFPVNSVWRYKVEPPGSTADYRSPTYNDSGWASGPGGFGNFLPGYDTPPVGTPIPYALNEEVWIRREFGPIPDGAMLLIDVWHDNVGWAYFNGEEIPLTVVGAYHSIALIPARQLTGSNIVAVRVRDTSVSYIYAGMALSYFTPVFADMNPAHIVRECLTDATWGMGYHDADIDDVAFMKAADQLYNETMGMSILWDRQIPLEQFIGEVLKHIDAALFVDRKSGKFVLKLVRDDYVLEDTPLFDPSNIAKIENFARREISELNNSVSVAYVNGETGKPASLTAQDPALIQQQGAVINTTMQYPGFTNATLASRAALRDLRSLSTPLISCVCYADWDGRDLEIGDVVRVNWPDYAMESLPMRVVGLSLGDGTDNKIRMNLAQDVFKLPVYGEVVPPDVGWVDPSQPATYIARQYAEELPYHELVDRMGQADTDAALALQPTLGIAAAAASRPQSNSIDATMLSDGGTGGDYEDVDTVEFCPSAELDGAQDRGFTGANETWLLKNVVDGDGILAGDVAKIGAELIYIVNYDHPNLEVKRAVLDTVPHPHADGAVIFFSDELAQADSTEYAQGDVVNIKLLNNTGGGSVAEDAADPLTVTMAARAIRPYPPINVKLNDAYWYAGPLDTDVTVTFDTRNRLLVEDVLTGWFDVGNGNEPGTTVTVRNINTDTETVTYTEANATSPLVVPLGSLATNNRMEVFTTRDGYICSYPLIFEFSSGAEFLSSVGKVIAVDFPYATNVSVSNMTAPITWSLVGTPPTGWSIDSSGVLGGTASVVGDYHFGIKAVDANSNESVHYVTVKIVRCALAVPATGTDGSTTFTDLTGKTITVGGTVAVDTDDTGFPAGAAYFQDSTGAYLRVAASSHFTFGTGDVTIEADTKLRFVGRNRIMFGWQVVGGSHWSTYVSGGDGKLYQWPGSGGNLIDAGTQVLTKQHVRYSRRDGRMRLHKDYTQAGGTAKNFTNFTDDEFIIGSNLVTPGNEQYAGHIGNVRVVAGVGLSTIPMAPMADFPLLVPGEVNRGKRYWRIFVSGNNDVSNRVAAVGELELQAVAGGPTLATGGTAFSDSQFPGGGYGPERAFDGGGNSTYWASDYQSVPFSFLGYDFGAGIKVEVNSVAVRGPSSSASNSCPMVFKVQSSDDAEVWFDEWSVTVGSDWANNERREFPRP